MWCGVYLIIFYLRISEKRRLRLVELESQIKGLKQEKREKEKMTKMKAQSDQKIATLNRCSFVLLINLRFLFCFNEQKLNSDDDD